MKCVIPASFKHESLYKNTIRTLPLLVSMKRMLSVRNSKINNFPLVYILIRTLLWALNPKVYLFVVYLMRLIITQADVEGWDD
jgi:hypothetical protein